MHCLWGDKFIVPFVSGNNTNADEGAGLPHDKTLTVSSANCSGDKCTRYSITPIIRINWDREPSGYAENANNWIFLSK
jgi:hypothetical protein